MQNNKEQENRKDYKFPLCVTTAMVTLLLMAGGLLTSSKDKVAISPPEAPTPSFSYKPELGETPEPRKDDHEVNATPAPVAAPFYVGGKRYQ
ncbi:MAG: hypothetical protein GW942_02625 [Candidatus Pacebacteria bacterium]|nr:hypothetical protein [Candidatus Paceibacterota bacterium]